jgi:adenine-specific DNA-methyltransferase
MLHGVENEVVKQVLLAFRARFTPGGRVLWVSEGSEPTFTSKGGLRDLGVRVRQHRDLPSVVIHAPKKGRLFLIDVASLRGPMTLERREALADVFRECGVGLIFVNAFRSRSELEDSLSEFPWETVVWFAQEPDHLVHFDGRRLFGPR